MQKIIMQRLEANCFGDRSIEIYGGAYHLFHNGEPSLHEIANGIHTTILNAKFFEPQTEPAIIARNFCHLLLIDPMLMEVYLGIRFSEL